MNLSLSKDFLFVKIVFLVSKAGNCLIFSMVSDKFSGRYLRSQANSFREPVVADFFTIPLMESISACMLFCIFVFSVDQRLVSFLTSVNSFGKSIKACFASSGLTLPQNPRTEFTSSIRCWRIFLLVSTRV